MSAQYQLRRSESVNNPNQALAQVGAGSRLSLSLVEAMPCRGMCTVERTQRIASWFVEAPEGAIVGRIGVFGKFRGIGDGRALPARLICKPPTPEVLNFTPACSI